MKRKRPRIKPSGWKESPRKPLSTEAKRRQRQWLADWRVRFTGLVAAEMERR